jgi:hypothetical protein
MCLSIGDEFLLKVLVIGDVFECGGN